MDLGARIAAWAKSGVVPPTPTYREGLTLYLKGVPANTTFTGVGLFQIRGTTNISLTIDWGDGTTETVTMQSSITVPSHTYTSAGDYELNIAIDIGDQEYYYAGCNSTSYPIIYADTVKSNEYVTDVVWCDSDGLLRYLTASTFRNFIALESVKFIGCDAFSDFGMNTFNGCSALETIILPDSTDSFPIGCFRNCSSLTTIKLPATMTTIGSSCFYGCTGLTSITSLAATPPTVSNVNAFTNVDKSIPVYVPSASIAAYQAATGWSDFTNIQAVT